MEALALQVLPRAKVAAPLHLAALPTTQASLVQVRYWPDSARAVVPSIRCIKLVSVVKAVAPCAITKDCESHWLDHTGFAGASSVRTCA
eukprot:1308420-Amphidinium_carterae.1